MILRGIGLALIVFSAAMAGATEVIPPAPKAYFNDYASLVRPDTAEKLNQELAQFERETSNQLVVAIFPRMESDSSVEDYAVRVAHAWDVGIKGRNNGTVLFIFAESHQIYIATSYGLEPRLTDVVCKRIIDNVIVPEFKNKDYDGGVTAGVAAIMAAARGEFKGTGQTVNDRRAQVPSRLFPFAFVILFIVVTSYFRRQASVYHSGGRSGFGAGMLAGMFLGGGGGFGGGGGGGGGGGFGGGFSGGGGGGGFGGGGAGGSW